MYVCVCVCVCVYPFFFIFFFIVVYHSILNIIHCAIQKDLVIYLFYIYQFVSANPKLPIQLSPTHLCLGNNQSVCVSDSVS